MLTKLPFKKYIVLIGEEENVVEKHKNDIDFGGRRGGNHTHHYFLVSHFLKNIC